MLARHLQKLPGSSKRIRDAALRYTYLLKSTKKYNAGKIAIVLLHTLFKKKFSDAKIITRLKKFK